MEITFIMLGVGISFFLLLWWSESQHTVSFEKEWPAISDDEFVNRCGPGTDRDKALKVRQIVATQLGLPYDHIYPEQNFVEDLGCD